MNRMMNAVAVGLVVACAAGTFGAESRAAGDAGGTVTFLAEQSVGGTILTAPGGEKAVTIDKACDRKWPEVVRADFKAAAPMPAGWWHGAVHLAAREKDDLGWVQAHFAVALMAPGEAPTHSKPQSLEGPQVSLMEHFSLEHLGQRQYSEKGPLTFEFWVYSASPAAGVSIRPVYDQAWRYKRQWPVSRIVMEHLAAAPDLGGGKPVALEVGVWPNGVADLPAELPPGNWALRAAMTKPGTVKCALANGPVIEAPFSFDVWKRPAAIAFYADRPVKALTFETEGKFKSAVLSRHRAKTGELPPIEGRLATTVDPAKVQTGRLELIGAGLTGEGPVMPMLPGGKKVAVQTTWDDGATTDLRLAELLNRLGYRPSFFLNQNNPGMKFLDKLEAQNVEIGSHCYTHTWLHAIAPERAVAECVAMRLLLERELGHPVISLAYPNGYTAAYDAGGDYVLRAMRAAGYWSGRTTLTGAETVDSIAEPLAFRTSGFFGDRAGLERAWAQALGKEGKEGGVFHIWGHSWQIGQTDAQWKDFEDFVAKFAKHPEAWYASQGELFVWRWARQNTKLAVTAKSGDRVVVEVSRPWLHPYLAARCPLSLRVPAGVTAVRWRGKDVPVKDGRVELEWGEE